MSDGLYYNHEEYDLAWKDTKKAESLNKLSPLFIMDLRKLGKKWELIPSS